VYLAIEEKEAEATSKASALVEIFRGCFRKINYARHPSNLPGEAQGKSSNVSWTAKELSKQYMDGDSRNDVIITIMDGLSPPHTKVMTRKVR